MVLRRQVVTKAAPASDREPAEPAPSTESPAEDREEFRLETTLPLRDVQTAIREYYIDKYPLFAASVNQRLNVSVDFEKLFDRETRRQIGELAVNSPVSEAINSFPGMPLVTFREGTRLSPTEALGTKVDLYQTDDETCRIVVTRIRRRANANETLAISTTNHGRRDPRHSPEHEVGRSAKGGRRTGSFRSRTNSGNVAGHLLRGQRTRRAAGNAQEPEIHFHGRFAHDGRWRTEV